MANQDVKRYLLFMYDHYYPSGGWSDFRGSFDTPEEAMAAAIERSDDNAELVDRETLQQVEFNYCEAKEKQRSLEKNWLISPKRY